MKNESYELPWWSTDYKSLRAGAGDPGSIPSSQEDSLMLSNSTYATTSEACPLLWSPCYTTKEATAHGKPRHHN